MKRPLLHLILLFLTFSLSAVAKNDKPFYENNKTSSRKADSISMKNISIGDVFIVDAKEYVVYACTEDPETKSFTVIRKDSLKSGTRFKILDTVSMDRMFRAVIELPDGSKGLAFNLPLIHKYCYKEGKSPIPSRIRRTVDPALTFTKLRLYVVLLITCGFSLLFLLSWSAIDRLLRKWSGKEAKVRRSGLLFLLASAVFGCLAGATMLFYDTVFKEFIMYLPNFTYPAGSGFIPKFYWTLQPFFLLFFGWAVFRSIHEFGVKAGLVRSLIMLLAGFAIFWTTMITSFLAIVVILILAYTTGMASDLEKGPQAETVVREETQTFTGEKKTVRLTRDAQGNMKSKKYI